MPPSQLRTLGQGGRDIAVLYLLRRVNRARAVLATFVILGGGAATLAAVAHAQQTVRPADPPATAALLVSRRGSRQARISSWLNDSFLCIHHFEGAWTSNTGNGYYGGLQLDRRFMVTYARDFVGRWGTADNWPVWAQLEAAARAYPARGFT